ncbi:hypothetical protein Tco_1393039 [Tanacetum coccineum]
MEMATRKPRQPTTVTDEEGRKKKKAPLVGKSKQPSPAKQSKPVKEKTSKPSPLKKIRKGRVMKIRKGRSSYHLVDEEEEEDQLELNLKWKMKNMISNERWTTVTQDAPTEPSAQPQDDTFTNMVRDSSSLEDSINYAENVTEMEQTNKERTVELDEGQTGSDPVYPQVHENLKLTTKEQVHIENPSNSSGTLSSLKNLDGALPMVINSLMISQYPPLSTPIIHLSPPKSSSTPIQEQIITVTTTTTTLPLPPPPPTKSTTYLDLNTRFSTLEMKSVDFEQKYKLQDKTIQALGFRVYTLKNHNLYSKINKQVNEVVKEAVHNALQAPLRECFRDLSEF